MYLTGDNFKKICDYIYEGDGLIKTDIDNAIPIIFIKTDFVFDFFKLEDFNFDYIIITHNSDIAICGKYKEILERGRLIRWYAQNVNFIHAKLISIPIGFANECWPHGNISTIQKVLDLDLNKSNLIYSNFDLSTNYIERSKCLFNLKRNKLSLAEKSSFENYLVEMKKSYFCISPNGNGVDCHKTWEALYLGVVPIVTRSINIEFYYSYPIYVIDDWNCFEKDEITVDLYENITESKKFNINEMELFINKILKT